MTMSRVYQTYTRGHLTTQTMLRQRVILNGWKNLSARQVLSAQLSSEGFRLWSARAALRVMRKSRSSRSVLGRIKFLGGIIFQPSWLGIGRVSQVKIRRGHSKFPTSRAAVQAEVQTEDGTPVQDWCVAILHTRYLHISDNDYVLSQARCDTRRSACRCR
jgi:hypothetical protein